MEVVLTAVFRSKLPQVQVLHGEVDEGGQLAGSPGFRETLQVLDRQESQGATTPHITTPADGDYSHQHFCSYSEFKLSGVPNPFTSFFFVF